MAAVIELAGAVLDPWPLHRFFFLLWQRKTDDSTAAKRWCSVRIFIYDLWNWPTLMLQSWHKCSCFCCILTYVFITDHEWSVFPRPWRVSFCDNGIQHSRNPMWHGQSRGIDWRARRKRPRMAAQSERMRDTGRQPPSTLSCKKTDLWQANVPISTVHPISWLQQRNEQELWSKINRVSSHHLIHFIQRQPELSKTVGQAQIKTGHHEGTPPVLELSSVSVAVWESSLSRRGKQFSVFRHHSGTTSVHLWSQIQVHFLSISPFHPVMEILRLATGLNAS